MQVQSGTELLILIKQMAVFQGWPLGQMEKLDSDSRRGLRTWKLGNDRHTNKKLCYAMACAKGV